MPLTNQVWRVAYLSVYFSVTAFLLRLWELLLILSSRKCFHLVHCENYGCPLMSFYYLHFAEARVAEIYSHKLVGCGCLKCSQLSCRYFYLQKIGYSRFDHLEFRVEFFPLIFKNRVLVR